VEILKRKKKSLLSHAKKGNWGWGKGQWYQKHLFLEGKIKLKDQDIFAKALLYTTLLNFSNLSAPFKQGRGRSQQCHQMTQ
jgi:hypothetical protein